MLVDQIVLIDFTAMTDNVDNICNVLFAILRPQSLLKRGLILKDRICSYMNEFAIKGGEFFPLSRELIISLYEQIFSFQSKLLFRRRKGGGQTV